MNIIGKIISKLKVNGILLCSEINRTWFLDFASSYGFLLINKKGKAIFITDSRYYEEANKKIKKAIVWCIDNTKENHLSYLIKKAKKDLGLNKIAIEEEYTNLSQFSFITNFWDAKDISCFISKTLREIKTKNEIELLQKAADIVCSVIIWLWDFIKPGMTEKFVAQAISIKILSLGAEGNSFSPIIAAGINGSKPHHHPSDYKIKDGDMITIDIGCVYKGYASDITRTFVLGSKCNSKEMLDIYKIVYEAQTKTLKKATNKISGADLDKYCRTIIDSTKYKSLFVHSTGHGVGLEVHELPNVNVRNKVKFVNNNVITIEPGIYKPNVGGVRIEDTIVIKNNNPIVLTSKCPKDLKFIKYKK